MTGQYLHPELGWTPVATVEGGGGGIEPYVFTVAGTGSTSRGVLLSSIGDGIWDVIDPTYKVFSYLFSGMNGISRVKINVPVVGPADGMFYGCSGLTTAPVMDTSAVTSMTSMFYNCSSLTTIPAMDTSAVTSMSGTFSRCSSLTTIPMMDTSAVASMGNMFNNCSSLTAIPALDTSAVTNMESMFNNCSRLTAIPALDTSAVTSLSSAFGTTSANTQLKALTSFKAYGATRGFVLQGTQMDAAALNELLTNLGTPAGSQTIDIRKNPGSATCDPSIGTAKGWTVLV